MRNSSIIWVVSVLFCLALVGSVYITVITQNENVRLNIISQMKKIEQVVKAKDVEIAQLKQEVDMQKQKVQEAITKDDTGFSMDVVAIDSKDRTIENPNAQFKIVYPRDASISVNSEYGVLVTKFDTPKGNETYIPAQLSINALPDKNLNTPQQLFTDIGLENCGVPEKTKNDTLYVECEESSAGQKKQNYFKTAAQLVWFSFTGDKDDWSNVLKSFTPVQ